MNNIVSLPLAILEEIGFEGLEGITLEGLWKRIGVRLKIPLPLNSKLTKDIWKFVQNAKCLQYYELPEEREPLKLFDRSEAVDPFFGLTEPDVFPFNYYKYNPISTQDIRGSCEHFDTRVEISKTDVTDYTIDEIEEKYGRRFVIVASQSLRTSLLIPPSISKEIELNIIGYCILERLGRARYNGEMAHGKYSLAELGGDPIGFHHQKKKLMRNKLIQYQTFTQNSDVTNITGNLVHLPRFFAQFKPRQLVIMEKIIGILKTKPNCMAEYHEVKGHFEEALQKSLQRLFKSPFFHRFVLTDTRVPYRAVHPNATEREWKLSKRDTERTLNVLQLRDSNLEPGQFWAKCESLENEMDDDDEENEGFLDESYAIRDVPLLHQLYNLIKNSKEKGVSESEATAHFGQSKLNGRALIRNLLKYNKIEFYIASHKRQTVRRYILPEYNSKHKQTVDEIISCSSELTTDPSEASVIEQTDVNLSTIDDNSMNETDKDLTSDKCINVDEHFVADEDNTLYDNPFRTEKDEHKSRIDYEISIKITEVKETNESFPQKRLLKENRLTDKMKDRLKFIQQEVQSKILFDDPSKLHNALKRDEAARGLKDIMCRKTFFRMLTYLCIKEKLRLWSIRMHYKTKYRELLYISNRSVDSNYSLMQSCIDQHKSKFHLNIYEEECRRENRKAKILALKTAELKTDPPKDTKPIIKNVIKLSAFTNQTYSYGITPKFIRLRTLHEFMFYLARDHEAIELTNQDEIIAKMHESSPAAFSDFDEELPMIWNTEIGWKMFVPPLIKHTGFDNGWCLLSDCIFRMPLSIFVKVVNITFEIKGLSEFISHPIKKHFLVKDIPVNLRQMLFTRRKHITSLHDLLRRLICMGVVQAGPHRAIKDQAFYYMNRFASLFDTSTSAPGAYYVSEQDYTELVYHFHSLESVYTYWDDMHRICMGTRLNKKPSGDQTPADKTLPNRLLPFVKAIQPRHAKDRDVGELPGDHRGAAGLDSYFFAHLERNWSFNPIKYKPKPQIKAKTVASTRYNRLVRITRDANLKKHESRITGTIPLHKLKSSAIRRRVPICRKKKLLGKKKRLRIKYDDIDRMALKHMNKLRVDWNPQEDNFLLLCRVASLYLNPTNRVLIPGHVTRDLIQWHCKSFNKTSYACRRRINYITKKLPNSNQINNSILMCINEIKTNKSLEKRFGNNFLQNLKKVYDNETEFNKAFRVHFIDLVHTLSCQYYKLTNSFESNILILPRTIQEFNARFMERNDSVYDSNTMRYDAPDSVDDIKIAQIVTLIHSTVCCSYDKTSWSIQLYEIYKDFPETLLSLAMRKVRSDQMISQHKLNSSQNKVQNRCLPLSSSGFHFSVTYQQQMSTKIAYDIFDDSYVNIKNILDDVNTAQQPHVLNVLNSAICFFISELLCTKNYSISIEIPRRILLLDPAKGMPSEESFEGVYERFKEIFNYIPKVDLADDSIDDFNSDLPSTESKSQTINETKNIIKKLEEMPTNVLHFICIINCFGVSKPRNQIELTEDGKCPYDCIRNLENPFECIMDKLVAKREVWYRLNVEQFQWTPLPAIVQINENNIVAIYNYLVLKSANTTDEQRNTNLELFKQLSDIVDELLLENDRDFIDDDFEYDLRNDFKRKVYDGSQTNDKIHKFHDFLCVNTCKLTLLPANTGDGGHEVIDLKELSKKRDNILAKIVQNSNWSSELRSNKEFVELLKEKNFEMTEIQIANDIYNYIDLQGELGAKAADLVERYQDKMFLQKILDFFNEAKLVMQTGVCEVTYVHWKHINPWTINTYHLKRHDREAATPSPKSLLHVSDVPTTSVAKRKANENDTIEIKRAKIDETSEKPESSAVSEENRTNTPDVSIQDNLTEECSSECSSKSKSSTNLPKRFVESIIEYGEELPINIQHQSKKTFPLKMAPWIRVNGSVNRRVLDKYAGTILLHCIENVGLTLFTLCTRFHYLLPIQVHEIIQYLEKYGCITKTTMTRQKKINLFSKYKSVTIGPATDLDDFKDIVIEPTIDAVTKMSIFIGNKKYKEDFI